MRFALLFLSILLFVNFSAKAQEIQLRMQLKLVDAPWWEELYLQIGGQADPVYENATLSISLYYYIFPPEKIQDLPSENNPKWNVTSFSVSISQKQNEILKILESWGPLNDATQEILPGHYEVEATLVWEKQNQDFQRRWKRKFGEQKPPKIRIYQGSMVLEKSQIFAIKEKELDKESEKWKKFYLDQILAINKYYKEFQKKKDEALRVQADLIQKKENFFIEEQKFSFAKWQECLQTLVSKILEKQNLLKRRKDWIYPLRYPGAHTNLDIYCQLLLRIIRITYNEVYHTYSSSSTKKQIPAGDNPQTIMRTIHKLQAKIAWEIEVPAKEILVY